MTDSGLQSDDEHTERVRRSHSVSQLQLKLVQLLSVTAVHRQVQSGRLELSLQQLGLSAMRGILGCQDIRLLFC